MLLFPYIIIIIIIFICIRYISLLNSNIKLLYTITVWNDIICIFSFQLFKRTYIRLRNIIYRNQCNLYIVNSIAIHSIEMQFFAFKRMRRHTYYTYITAIFYGYFENFFRSTFIMFMTGETLFFSYLLHKSPLV